MNPVDHEPLRVGVVGTGGWGEQHARIFAHRPDTQLVGVLGRDAARAEARAARYESAAFTSLDAFLDTKPDLITVCLPNEGHFDMTMRLLETGIPLLVEKPLVFDLNEADQLLAAAEASGSFFGINFNHRYAEPVRRAKAAIDAGELGQLVFATWRFGGEANHGTSKHANLIETQCHGFDMLEHLVAPISSVMAQMTDATYGDWSTVAIALEFANGAVGTMLGSYDSSYTYPDSQLIEVNGTTGRAAIRDTVRELELSRAGDEVTARWRAGYFDDEARWFAGTFDRHVDDVIRAVRAGGPPPIHARAGRRALELAHLAIESHALGKRVAVPPPTP